MDRGSVGFWAVAVFCFALLDGFAVALFLRIKRERDAAPPAPVAVDDRRLSTPARHAPYSRPASALRAAATAPVIAAAPAGFSALPTGDRRLPAFAAPLGPQESCAGGFVYRIELLSDGSRAPMPVMAAGHAVRCWDGWRE